MKLPILGIVAMAVFQSLDISAETLREWYARQPNQNLPDCVRVVNEKPIVGYTTNAATVTTNAISSLIQTNAAGFNAAMSNIVGALWITNAEPVAIASYKWSTLAAPTTQQLARATQVILANAALTAAWGTADVTQWHFGQSSYTVTNPAVITAIYGASIAQTLTTNSSFVATEKDFR